MGWLEADWQTKETLTDEYLLEVFHHVAKQLSGLVVHEHADGKVLIFVDSNRRLLHAAFNISENNWGCFCDQSADDECAATTYARVRQMRSR